MPESDGEYILDLARMLVELDDEALTTKNLMACIFAMSVKTGLCPGQFLPDFADNIPDYEEWFETYLPQIVDVPDDYESVNEEN